MHLFSSHVKAKFTNNGCKGVIPHNASLHACYNENITKSEHRHRINDLCTCIKKKLVIEVWESFNQI